jgi:DNA-nicking Smr family endonuclease
MRRRRPPTLTSEERQLWAQVARGVTPLKGRARDPEPGPDTPEPPKVKPKSSPTNPAQSPGPKSLGPSKLPPLASIERRTVSALRRGKQGIEGVVDLHGLRQGEAHAVLSGFLRRSQAAGLKVVLVITGKGDAAEDAPFGERGVLRRAVPHWLRLPDLRPLVVGFEEAAPQHGGAGALYVRLRRPTRREGA